MFANIHELRDMLSLMIEVIDERDYLLKENMYLTEQLEQKRKDEMEMYHKNISTTAEILNIMIEKADNN